MAEFAVRYTQPLLGAANSAGYLVAVPGVSVLIRQDGVTCDVFADNDKTPMDNPVPTGVPPGTAGVDTTGNLCVYLVPGRGYTGVATVGNASSTFAIPDISLDSEEPIEATTVADAAITNAKVAADAAIAQSKVAGLVSDLAGKQATIPSGTYVREFDALKFLASGTPGLSATLDTAAIQAAVAAASAAGGVALISDGTWLGKRQSDSHEWCVQVLASNVTVRLSAGATFKLANGELTGTKLANLIRVGDGTTPLTNVHVDGPGTIDGNRANNTTAGDISNGAAVLFWGPHTNISCNGVRVVHGTRDAVVAQGIINVTRAVGVDIIGNYIDDCAEGILWIDCDWVRCLGNTVKNIYSQDAIEPVQSSHFIIADNIVDNVVQSIDLYSGLDHFECVRNICRDFAGIAVNVGGPEPVTDGLVADNDITSANRGSPAIQVDSGTGSSETHRIRVVRNRISDSNLSGIVVGASGSGVLDDVKIDDNSIYDCDQWGIRATSGTGVKIRRNSGKGFDRLAPGDAGALSAVGVTARIDNNDLDGRFVVNLPAEVTKSNRLSSLAHWDQIQGDGVEDPEFFFEGAASLVDGFANQFVARATGLTRWYPGRAGKLLVVTMETAADITGGTVFVSVRKNGGTPLVLFTADSTAPRSQRVGMYTNGATTQFTATDYLEIFTQSGSLTPTPIQAWFRAFGVYG